MQLAPKRMSLAFEDDHVRLTLEVAPGGEAVRVVLMSKRFERLQAARARDGARVAPDPSGRIQRLGAVCRADHIHQLAR